MSSQSFIPSLAQAEAEADRLLDELFGEVEATLKEGEQSEVHSHSQSVEPARPPAPLMASMLWVAIGALGTVAIAALALWWSFVHLPQKFAAQSPPIPTPDAALDFENAVGVTDSALTLASSEAEVSNVASLESEDLAAAPPASRPAPPAPAVSPPATVAPSPATVPSPPAIAAAAPIDAAVPDFQLMGIMDGGSDGQPVALLIVDDLLQTIPAGATIENGWRVASIRDRQVRVTNGRRTLTLQVGLQ
ncbi:hypothetical protein [Synechococcus sp. PCC 7336]|uniref:hypothetical protein n=1 Tax=Synechococcus sp. PCC 7336 TaxID=195250 RepID=UPI000344F6BD|nr:hypothetical protein [Synechococcus sp. PCC 7336]